MKTLVVQGEFIKDLFLSNNSSNDHINSLCKFLTKEFSAYNLICDFSNVNDYQEASLENPIWELMLDKINEIKYVTNLDSMIKSDDLYNTIGEHNLFLTTCSSEECDNLMADRGYLYLCIENIELQWEIFNLCKNGYQFKVTSSTIIPESNRLNDWNKIEKFAVPFTSIIIFDKYILKNKALQKIDDNLCPLLKRLLLRQPKKKSVQITILCDLEDRETLKEKHTLVMEALNKAGIKNVNLNIIKYDKSLKPIQCDSIHSRFILTNYLHISSTDSFNFFQPKGKINNDSDVIFKFNLPNKNFCFFSKELNDVKSYLNGINNNPNCPVEKHRELYFSTKDNYLFN